MQTFLLAIAALALVMTALTAAELRQHVTGAKGERQQADADAIRNHGGYDRGRRTVAWALGLDAALAQLEQWGLLRGRAA